MSTKPELMSTAAAYCERNKLRFTEPRRAVLEILERARTPMVAYKVLEELGHVMDNPKPPTVYRAIEFWQEHGFIHRIESLNAYTLCVADHRHEGSQYMICDQCGGVDEVHLCTLPEVLEHAVSSNAFTMSRWVLEIHGTCSGCRSSSSRG